jgi:hypothetical protein
VNRMRYASAADIVQTKELADRATARLAWTLSSDRALTADPPLDAFCARGFSRYIRDASAILFNDPDIAETGLNAAFLAAVDRESIVGQLDAARMPLGGSARIQIGAVPAAVVAEGGDKPIARIDFTLDARQFVKVPATIVASVEALRHLGSNVQAGLTRHLIAACAAAADVYLVDAFTAGSPAGSSDPGTLLMAISGGAPRRPALIGGFDSFLALAPGTLRDLRDLGVRIITTPSAAGRLVAVDTAGLLLADVSLDVMVARHASVMLDTGSPSSAALVNLWQANLVAIRAERFMRIVFRPDAVAYASVGGSPA